MKANIPEYVVRSLRDLEYSIERDSFNLTRLDQDAILLQISNLREFIQAKYDKR